MKHLFVLFLLPLLIFNSCGEEDKTDYRANANGKPGDIRIIIGDRYLNGNIGQMLKDSLNQYCKGLYVKEQMFDTKFITKSKSTKSDKLVRNIIEVNIENGLESNVVIHKDHKWAKGQMYVKIEAPNENKMLILLSKELSSVLKEINNYEKERVLASELRNVNTAFKKKLKETQGVEMAIPTSYENIKRTEPDFIWAVKEKKPKKNHGLYLATQHLFVYNYPINSLEEFNKKAIIWKRDMFFKEYVQFHTRDKSVKSYLKTTPEETFPIYSEEKEINGSPVLYLKGNFGSTNENGNRLGFGGYFILYAVYDKKNGRVVVFDGCANVPDEFIYREYLREYEALFESAKIQ